MKGRGLVVFLALILATLATAGVFMYSRGVKDQANTGGTMVQVVVSKVDLPARSDLDQLIKDDQFKIVQVPADVVVSGAVTSVDQLAGKSNVEAILAGEQIPTARISGDVPGGLWPSRTAWRRSPCLWTLHGESPARSTPATT